MNVTDNNMTSDMTPWEVAMSPAELNLADGWTNALANDAPIENHPNMAAFAKALLVEFLASQELSEIHRRHGSRFRPR